MQLSARWHSRRSPARGEPRRGVGWLQWPHGGDCRLRAGTITCPARRRPG